MLRKNIHLQVQAESDCRILACHLFIASEHVDWFLNHDTSTLSELCSVIGSNLRMIESSSNQDTQADGPAQLFGTTIRIAFIACPQTDASSYALLSDDSGACNRFQVNRMFPFRLDPLWVFPLDSNDPDRHKPLPIWNNEREEIDIIYDSDWLTPIPDYYTKFAPLFINTPCC